MYAKEKEDIKRSLERGRRQETVEVNVLPETNIEKESTKRQLLRRKGDRKS